MTVTRLSLNSSNFEMTATRVTRAAVGKNWIRTSDERSGVNAIRRKSSGVSATKIKLLLRLALSARANINADTARCLFAKLQNPVKLFNKRNLLGGLKIYWYRNNFAVKKVARKTESRNETRRNRRADSWVSIVNTGPGRNINFAFPFFPSFSRFFFFFLFFFW